jgi:hypothetical protein
MIFALRSATHSWIAILRSSSEKKRRLSRDYLDENGGGQSEFEAAAGSEVMIGLGPEVRKHFFWVSVFDCR